MSVILHDAAESRNHSHSGQRGRAGEVEEYGYEGRALGGDLEDVGNELHDTSNDHVGQWWRRLNCWLEQQQMMLMRRLESWVRRVLFQCLAYSYSYVR